MSKNQCFWQKIVQKHRGPRLWGLGRGRKKTAYIRKGAPKRQKGLKTTKKTRQKKNEKKDGAIFCSKRWVFCIFSSGAPGAPDYMA